MEAMKQIDIEATKNHFDRAAAGYDKHARLQENIIRRASLWLNVQGAEGVKVADLGCGTGASRRYLSAETIIGLDIAYHMAEKSHERNLLSLQGNIGFLPFADEVFDGLLSCSAMQWVEDKRSALSDCYRVLKPGGHGVITSFGPRTLHELRDSFSAADQHSHVMGFTGRAEWSAMLQETGFVVEREEAGEQHYWMDSPMEVVRHLKGLGATYAHPERRAGLMGKAAWAAMEARYMSEYARLNKVPVTWEVLLFYVRKKA